MQAIKNHIQALQITFSTILKGRFLWFFLPGVIIALGYFFIVYMTHVDFEKDPAEMGWLETIGSWLYSAFTFVLEKIYIFLVITLLSPFHAFIAERFDTSMTGKKFPYNFNLFVQDFFRMLAVVSIALFMELGFMLVWWTLSFIPGLSYLDDLMYFMISAFFFGFAFHDYALERYRLNIGKSILFAFNNPLSMLLTGSIFLGIYAIPYVGVPISSVITTMVATVVYLRVHNRIDEKRTEIDPE